MRERSDQRRLGAGAFAGADSRRALRVRRRAPGVLGNRGFETEAAVRKLIVAVIVAVALAAAATQVEAFYVSCDYYPWSSFC